MNLIEQALVRRFHKERIREFGAGNSRSLGWKADSSQLVRFGMLEGIGDMNGCSVLDAGCGYGDLRTYLAPKYPQLRYTGIDMLEEFITVAVERCGHLSDTAFYLGNFLEAALPNMDYVLASGSLSYRSADPDFIYKAITKLFNTCSIAFGFNLLSKIDYPDSIITIYPPTAIVRFCQTLTDKVVLHEGYFEGDFTVWMRR
jgi:SAM-dependent methyltransferase